MRLLPSGNVLKRIGVTLALGAAFIVMASIFTPERSKAGDDRRTTGPASNARASDHAPSAEAHDGLHSLGVIESGAYVIAIFGTDLGPRYTIFDGRTQVEVGTLLTAEQVQQLLPEVDLKALDFSAPPDQQPLMLAEPRQ